MAFNAGRIVREPAMSNRRLLLTDRNDLDDQLFGTFSRCSDFCVKTPTQAGIVKDLTAEAVGIVWPWCLRRSRSFLMKVGDDPMLSDRRNIVVIADERASEPVRLRGWVCGAHAGCVAECVIHRVHGDADRN